MSLNLHSLSPILGTVSSHFLDEITNSGRKKVDKWHNVKEKSMQLAYERLKRQTDILQKQTELEKKILEKQEISKK